MRWKRTMIGAMLLIVATAAVSAKPCPPSNDPSQDPSVLWTKTFGGPLIDWGNDVEETSDGGFIFTGTYGRNLWSLWVCQIYLVKTDSAGTESWSKTFGPAMTENVGSAVCQTTDGGYALTGYTGDIYTYSVIVIKTDSNGDLEWQNTYSVPGGIAQGYDIGQTDDGGYYVLATTTIDSDSNVWLLRITSNGTLLWERTFGGPEVDFSNRMAVTPDGGCIFVGTTCSYNPKGDLWVVKMDPSGNQIWNRTEGTPDTYGEGNCIYVTEDSRYIVLSSWYSDDSVDGYLRIDYVDLDGAFLWSETYGHAGKKYCGVSVTATYDNGYFITGYCSENTSEEFHPDAYLLKVNSRGYLRWEKTLDLSNGFLDQAFYGIELDDGGYAVVGKTGDEMSESTDAFLLRIDNDRGVEVYSAFGGRRVTVQLFNYDSEEATASVSVTVFGGLLNRINVSDSEEVTVPAFGIAEVSCEPFVGLGPIVIKVEVDGADMYYYAFHLIFITMKMTW